MSVEFKTLDNGITIINDQIDVESASIGVWIGAGSSNENNDECGIAHMLEHMAFKGTKNRNAETICLLYTSPSPRDISGSRMPSSA